MRRLTHTRLLECKAGEPIAPTSCYANPVHLHTVISPMQHCLRQRCDLRARCLRTVCAHTTAPALAGE
ncbi:hypothetical protein BDV93DRAFT_528267 [Ceratobasidium sp. AG-I]|nr:hypothetical protein BDV93DRAFT_528267 [Ceratobasidium sp. AG-I]